MSTTACSPCCGCEEGVVRRRVNQGHATIGDRLQAGHTYLKMRRVWVQCGSSIFRGDSSTTYSICDVFGRGCVSTWGMPWRGGGYAVGGSSAPPPRESIHECSILRWCMFIKKRGLCPHRSVRGYFNVVPIVAPTPRERAELHKHASSDLGDRPRKACRRCERSGNQIRASHYPTKENKPCIHGLMKHRPTCCKSPTSNIGYREWRLVTIGPAVVSRGRARDSSVCLCTDHYRIRLRAS